MNPVNTNKNYPVVDCFKFICCILIMAIHAKPFEPIFWLDGAVGLATRIAVPYFFVASGFFFFNGLKARTNPEERIACLKKYEWRMFRFYAVWFVIQNMQSVLRGYVYSPMYYIRHFIWPNNGTILWFLPATMFAVFIVYGLSNWLSAKKVFIISIIVWVIGYALSTWAPVFSKLVSEKVVSGIQQTIGIQNGLFFGFPYIAMANLFAESRHMRQIKRDIIGVVVSFTLLAVESLFVVKRIQPVLTFLWLSALPMTYYTFHLTITCELKERKQYTVLRKLSTLVYVLHPVLLNGLQDLFTYIHFNDRLNLVLYFSLCTISLMIAYLLFKLSQTKRGAVLKLLM